MSTLKQFAEHKYLNLMTLRKNGAQMPTPVWFAEHDGALWVQTGLNAGKVKRIRNTPAVRIAPCDSRGRLKGTWIDAQASIVTETQAAHAQALLLKKYGLIKRLFDLTQRRGYDVIRITPIG
jgi:uncharacterized protein